VLTTDYIYHLSLSKRLLLKGIFLILMAFCLFNNQAIGQKVKVKIYGEIKDENSKKRLAGVTVSVTSGGSNITSQTTTSNGKFDVDLDYDKVYVFKFEKSGFVTKKLEVDTRNIPAAEQERGEFIRPIDMTLFENVPDVDFSVLNEPIGKFRYDFQFNDILHDEDYTKQMKKKLDKLFKELEDKMFEQEQKLKAFEKLIKDGNKDFDKAKYKDAMDKFEAALKLFPDDTDAKMFLEEAKEKWEAEQGAALKEKQYNDLISEGDQLMKKENYEEAKAKYEEALKIKPNEKLPKTQIDKINDILKQLLAEQGKKEEYNNLIKEADQAFNSKQYEEAKTNYNKALALFPKETHPQNKIKEIDDILKQLAKEKEAEEQYNKVIASADQAFDTGKLDEAKKLYQDAQKLKASEDYPKNKIAEIDKLLDEQKQQAKLQEQFNKLMTDAEKAFGKKSYEEAKKIYSEASGLKPDEQLPKDKIAEIDKILSEQANQLAQEQEYNDLIKKANDALAKEELTNARELYANASNIKPDEKLPKDKIAEIDKKLAEQEKKEQEYAQLIKSGDDAFNSQNYEAAKESFKKASAIKPGEKYPTDKITEIDNLLKQLADAEKNQKKYDEIIAAANKSFDSKDYAKAKNSYQEAFNLKPDEAFPKQRIEEIDNILSELAMQESLEKQYKELIDNASKSFSKKEYSAAKNSYQEALALKPNEQMPKDKIAEIDEILAALSKENELEAQYNSAIEKGDYAFNTEKYQEAKQHFTEASQLKPKEKYPAEKLKEIESILAGIEKGKEVDEKYLALIKQGDQAFSQEKLQESKKIFEDAQKLKPTEDYPKEMINKINEQLDANHREKELMDEYKKLIDIADRDFKNQELVKARGVYEEALKILPSEQYPKQRIKEIDAAISELSNLQEKEEKYNDLITKADNSFSGKDYDKAKDFYQEALKIKPNEAHPKNRISEIDNLLNQMRSAQEKDAKYQDLVNKGDQALNKKNYQNAIDFFTEAGKVKPEESYPPQKIKEIEQLIREQEEADKAADNQKRKEQEFNTLIKQGDTEFNSADFEKSIDTYNKALKIKPGDSSTQQKIDKAKELLANKKKEEEAERKAKDQELSDNRNKAQQEYNRLIALADDFFSAKQYDDAIDNYTKAKKLRPTQTYPDERIEEINRLLAAQKQKQEDKQKELAESKEKEKQKEKTGGAIGQPNYGTRVHGVYGDDILAEIERERAKYRDERLRQIRDFETRVIQDQYNRRNEIDDRSSTKHEAVKDYQEELRQSRAEANERHQERASEVYDFRNDYKENRRRRSANSEDRQYKKFEDLNNFRKEYYQSFSGDEIVAENRRIIDEKLESLQNERQVVRTQANEQSKARRQQLVEKQESLDYLYEVRSQQTNKRILENEEFKNEYLAYKNEIIGQSNDRVQERYTESTLRKEELTDMFADRSQNTQLKTDNINQKKYQINQYRTKFASEQDERSLEAIQDLREKEEAYLQFINERSKSIDDLTAETYNNREAIEDTRRKMREESNERILTANQNIIEKRENLDNHKFSNNERIADNYEELSETKNTIIQESKARSDKHGEERDLKRETLYKDYAFTPPSRYDSDHAQQLRDKYPIGVTEEIYEDGNRKTIRRIVITESTADDFHAVVNKWATYFFKNGTAIAKHQWDKETKD
jgi:tetratricopeptide (TPR) repeat protein